MLIAVVSVLGGLSVIAWLVVAWQSKRRQPWLLAPIALAIPVLLVLGLPGWALLPIAALAAGTFAELVIGAREPPALRTSDPGAPLSTERWAAAVAAPYRVALAEPWDVVAYRGLRRRYRRALQREWGAVDRASLLAAVDELWSRLHTENGMDLELDLRTGTAATRGYSAGPGERRLLLTPEEVRRMREVTGADDNTEKVVVVAVHWWQAAQLVRLACAGATLDWLSPSETQSLLRRVAADLQRRYVSWRQLAQAFHGGYLIGNADRERGGEPDRVWTALGLLATDPDSPWNQLPWDMPLERTSNDHPVPSAR